MSNKMNSASRLTIYCYFCNEPFDERYLPEHVQHCGAVLTQCPEKCGSYIPRRSVKSHGRQCPKRIYRNSSPPSNNIYAPLVKNEIPFRDNAFGALTSLRSAIADGERERKWLRQNLAITTNRLDTEENTVLNLRQITVQELHNARQRTIAIEAGINKLQKALSDVEERTCSRLNEVAYRLKALELDLANQSKESFKKELKELKTFVAKESTVVGDLWENQTRNLNDLKLELEIRCKISKELENKQDVLSEKIDIIVEEMRQRGEEIRKQSESIKKMKTQMKEVFDILEVISDRKFLRTIDTCQCRHDNFRSVSNNGRLLWRIDRYKEKMTEAKENDSVIYSPVFNNKDYGYSLRMELFFNGRRQWKGRHIIGCLRVVEGPWDPLLDWPCVLRAAVTLRDQENPANDLRKTVKTRSKGQDDKNDSFDKDSGLHMFIPHSHLTRYSGFTKHNAMFLDIQVTDLRASLSTSSLVA